MIGGTSMSRIRFGLTPAVLLVACLAAISLQACIVAIPLVISYFKTDENYVAEVDTRKSADEVWTRIVPLAEKSEAEGRIKILKKNDTERLLKVTDGVQTAEVKVFPLGEGESSIIVLATVPEGEKKRERGQELAARIMKGLCKEAEVECILVEK